MKKLFPIILFAIITSAPVLGENVRGPIAAVIDPSVSATAVRFRPGELVVLELSSENPLHTALKIEIAIPEAVAGMRGAYAVYLYNKVDPPPRDGLETYRATRIDFLLLPPSRIFTIQLPYTAGFKGTESFDVIILDQILKHGDYPLLLAIQPVMKGIPSRVADSTFSIIASVVLSSMGVLKLDLEYPGNEELPYVVGIDGSPPRGPFREYTLSEGIHTLQFTSPHYTDQSRTFTIKGGAYTEVSFLLVPRSSRVIIEVPETAQVFLDGSIITALSPEGTEIAPGQHTILMKIGNYSLTEQFTVKPGVTYTLSLQMNILIESR